MYVSNVAQEPTCNEDRRLKLLAEANLQAAEALADSDNPSDRQKAQLLQEHAYELQQQRIANAATPMFRPGYTGAGGAAPVAKEKPLGMPKIDWGRANAAAPPTGKEAPLGLPKMDWGKD